VIDQASAAWVGTYRGTSALANACSVPGRVRASTGVPAARRGGHELLEHLRRVELVALGEVEQDGAVDATRLLLVQGGVVDGDRVEGPVVAWSRTRNPPMEKPRPPTGPPTVRSRRAAMAASSLARALALSMASMSASACSGSLAVRPS
jgi:hypothetical protein